MKKYLTLEGVEMLKKAYPRGTRVILDSMDDQQAPPPGTTGTVTGVDDLGTIHVDWDNRAALGIVFGEDTFHKA